VADGFDIPKVEHAVDEAEAAIAEARALRHSLRWKAAKDDKARRGQLEAELEFLRLAMIPVRSYMGRLVREPLPDALEGRLRDVSRQLQRERKSLKRMLK
jgi:hypothetical protein